jgi:hypothetical protein
MSRHTTNGGALRNCETGSNARGKRWTDVQGLDIVGFRRPVLELSKRKDGDSREVPYRWGNIRKALFSDRAGR